MSMMKRVGLTATILVLTSTAYSQVKSVYGTVTDQDGLPLPGVNIEVSGSIRGTHTDFQGNYSIAVEAGKELYFSYIAQRAETVTIGAETRIDIQMVEDPAFLPAAKGAYLDMGSERRTTVTIGSLQDDTRRSAVIRD